MQTNSTSTNQEVQKYIESLGLGPDQLEIVKAINALMEAHSKSMEKRFAALEASLKQYLGQKIDEHLKSVDDELNRFLGVWYKNNMVPRELNDSMKNLFERIKYMKGKMDKF